MFEKAPIVPQNDHKSKKNGKECVDERRRAKEKRIHSGNLICPSNTVIRFLPHLVMRE